MLEHSNSDNEQSAQNAVPAAENSDTTRQGAASTPPLGPNKKADKPKKESLSSGKTVVVAIVCAAALLLGLGLCFAFRYNIFGTKGGDVADTSSHGYTQYGTQEQVEKAVAAAKDKLSKNPQKAALFASDKDKKNRIELAFEGSADDVTMQLILDLLKQHDKKATFYISGMGAAEDDETVAKIYNAGHNIGSYTLNGERAMQKKSSDELIADFCRAQVVISSITGKAPVLMRCNATEYTDELLKVADACGIKEVLNTRHVVNYQSFGTKSMVEGYVNGIERGSIVSVKISDYIDEIEYEEMPKDDKPAVDKKPGLSSSTEPKAELSENEQLVRMVSWLLDAIDNTDYAKVYDPLRKANNGKLAESVKNLKTIDRGVIYTFSGLNDGEEYTHLVQQLESLGAKATFFINEKEIVKYPKQVSELISKGFELGIAIAPTKNFDFYSACNQIDLCRKMLKEQFNYESKVVSQSWGEINNETLEAVSSLGMRMIARDTLVLDKEEGASTSSQDVMDSIFAKENVTLKRGQIVFYSFNYYKDPKMLGDVVKTITTAKTTYPVKTASAILDNTQAMYTYPVADETILPEVKNKIYPGQLNTDLFAAIRARYIGSPDADGIDKLPDFTESERQTVDINGRIPNSENAVFLTFDDWGSDIAIDKILTVLDKHNVKGTFFVRTNNISHNPNLLRAIAASGHDIGDHTHMHLTLADDVDGDSYFTAITKKEATALRDDIVVSYNTLQSVIGDVSVDGRPALTRLFRPPTLAVSKLGLEQVLDCGYSHVVSGNYTTGDYAAKSKEEILKTLNVGIFDGTELNRSLTSGSIIIMHMSDNGKYTAAALDDFLTQNERRSAGDPKKFVFRRLSDYLK